jgi:hypothetical protein
MISTELFPYENHPYRLEFGEKKNLTLCFFECKEHLDKYIERYKLKAKDIQVQYRDEQPIKSSKTNKKNLQQTVEKDNHRSAGGHRRSTKNLDTTGTVSRTRKPKK